MPNLHRRDLLRAISAIPFVLAGGRAADAAPSAAPSAARTPSAEQKLVVENITKSFATTHAEMLDLNDVLKAISKLDPPTPGEAGMLAAVQARLKADDDWLAAITKSGITAKA